MDNDLKERNYCSLELLYLVSMKSEKLELSVIFWNKNSSLNFLVPFTKISDYNFLEKQLHIANSDGRFLLQRYIKVCKYIHHWALIQQINKGKFYTGHLPIFCHNSSATAECTVRVVFLYFIIFVSVIQTFCSYQFLYW